MSHSEKSAYYQELKAAGVAFTKKYQQYTTDELRAAVLELRQQRGIPEQGPPAAAHHIPVSESSRDTYAGEHAYDDAEKPVRIEPSGRIWYAEEVRKPGSAKPRARRKLTYVDPGTRTEQAQDGAFIETFEVAGNERRTAEVKITMPSYQVGIYKEPNLPFKTHVYNGKRGFDLFDVHKFYGGADLVPSEIKRVYVENDLCYDITSTIRAIQAEARQLALKGF